MFEKAVELSPNSESFVGNLGDGYRWAGQPEKAKATYEKAIALALKELQVDRRNAVVRGSLGLYYAKIGDVKQADRFIRDARAIDRSNVLLMFEEAIIYALSNRNAEALTALEEALKAGYPVSMIQSDPDLRTVRQDPRFENLVKQIVRKTQLAAGVLPPVSRSEQGQPAAEQEERCRFRDDGFGQVQVRHAFHLADRYEAVRIAEDPQIETGLELGSVVVVVHAAIFGAVQRVPRQPRCQRGCPREFPGKESRSVGRRSNWAGLRELRRQCSEY